MRKEGQGSAGRQSVQSVETGMDVLKGLARIGGGASLSALAASLDMHTAKAHRYLVSLVNAGLVYQDAATSRYVLGSEAITIGLAAIGQSDVLGYSAQALQEIRDQVNVSCFVAVMGNKGPTIVRWVESTYPLTMVSRVGTVMPVLWSATGRVFGAWLYPRHDIEALVHFELQNAASHQRRHLPHMGAVTDLFAGIRRQGYATITDDMLVGISAIAVPVLNFDGEIVAALAGLGYTGTFDIHPDNAVGRVLRDKAAEISARLGYRPAPEAGQ